MVPITVKVSAVSVTAPARHVSPRNEVKAGSGAGATSGVR
jgi:hypothetical protein